MNRRSALKSILGAAIGGRKVVGDVAQGIAAQPSLRPGLSNAVTGSSVGFGAARPIPAWLKVLEDTVRERESDVYDRANAFQDAIANRVPPDIAALQSTAAHWRGHVHLRRYRREVKGPLEQMRKRINDWYSGQTEEDS